MTLALVAGLSRPAGRYFYCEAMGMLSFDPCAASAAEHVDDGAADHATSTIGRYHADCCDVVMVPPPPRVTIAQTPTIPPPALVALLPAPPFPRAQVLAPARSHTSVLERWRLPPRPPGQARAQLMVFVT